MKVWRSVCSLGLCAAFAVSSAFSQALPDALVREVPANDKLPQGNYRLIRAWEAETSVNHLTGRAVDDASASGGKAWEARLGVDTTDRHMIYGPYLDVPAGNYVAFFRLKLPEAIDDDIVASIDATVATGAKNLGMRNVWTGDLACDRYVQIPFAFHSPGGILECRLIWNGFASLRLDQVTLFALEGLGALIPDARAPSAEPSGKPDNLAYRAETRPFPEVFPRAQKPMPRLTVMDLKKQPYDKRLLMLCVQGLVNRERPSLYALFAETDRQWLDWMKKRGWVEGEDAVADPLSLVARYRDRIKGAVIYDSRLAASKNVAMMVASVRDGVAVSPRLARELGLPVLEDLRGRWKTNAEAYRWAFDTLWPQQNHFVMACLHSDRASGLRDYLYQQRVFTFWISGPIDGAQPGGDPTAEARVMETILAQAPANIPVLGFPWSGDDVGIGEGGGVRLLAQYAKFLVGAVDVGNLSVHSGYDIPTFKQRRTPAPALQPDKVYLTWLMSDGDNLPVLYLHNFPQLWRDPNRGRVPIAWSLSPSAALLMPAVVDYYFETATANDAFVSAVSGIGYTYPEDFAQRFTPEARTRLFGDFLGLTRRYLPRSDLKEMWIMGISQPEMISRYAAEIPEIDAIFPDYGKRLDRYDETFYPVARGVPVFHAVTHWEENVSRARKVDSFVEQIRAATPPERPAFLHAFIWNWGADLSVLPEVMQRLGPDYIAVGPDHLAALAKQSLSKQHVRIGTAPRVAVVEGRPAVFQATVHNTTGTPLAFRAAVTEGLRAAEVAPARGEIPAYQSATITCRGQPSGSALRLSLSGDWGDCAKSVALQTVPARELAGAVPDGATLGFTDSFSAAGLSHRAGASASDPTSASGNVWTAQPGRDKAGHIVFGPFKSFPAGHYLALFRIKRTGAGNGALARIDIHLGGEKGDSGARSIAAGDAPLNEWRSYPLEFTIGAGGLETRVYWPGTAPIAVDEILVWKIVR